MKTISRTGRTDVRMDGRTTPKTHWPEFTKQGLSSRPGHTALHGRIAAESRPKISAREADAVGRFEVAIKTRYSRTLPVVTRGKKFTRGWPREKVLGCPKI